MNNCTWFAAITILTGWIATSSCTPAQHVRCQPGKRCSDDATDAVTKKPERHVIVVSVDGMMPETYTNPDKHGLRIPTLRKMVAEGAHAKGVRSVFPSVTYPAHTSMVTGVQPQTHGIVTNRTWDPLAKNKGGWFWYTEDIAVPTIWQVAEAADMITALINWPVTVGAKADHLVAEYWRAGTLDDVKLHKALSTPGLLDQVGERYPNFWKGFRPPDILDEASIDVAEYLLEKQPPELMLIHIWMVDEYQHQNGPWSPEAKERIETADTQIGRLIKAAKRAGIWERTTLFVVSDHGFLPVEKRVYPGVFLRERGLLTMKEDKPDQIEDWRAVIRAESGLAYIYVKDDADAATVQAVQAAIAELVKKPEMGIARVFSRAEIIERGGDGKALLALEAHSGFSLRDGYTGPLTKDTPGKGSHGYDPERPELQASLLVYGPGVGTGEVANARLIDMAPTWAHHLGLRMPESIQGQALTIPTAGAPATRPQ